MMCVSHPTGWELKLNQLLAEHHDDIDEQCTETEGGPVIKGLQYTAFVMRKRFSEMGFLYFNILCYINFKRT